MGKFYWRDLLPNHDVFVCQTAEDAVEIAQQIGEFISILLSKH